MTAMEELETLLQSLQALKPPGVTKTKIEAIAALCNQNVQSESTIVQKIFQQFRNSAATHKLGVLYVVDSVTRQWMEKARNAGQVVSRNAPQGTFAAGVQKVTDMLPNLMTDLILSVPDNQKEKISKLLDIWERGQTFPLNELARFKQQLSNPQSTHTPSGSPPTGPVASLSLGSQANSQPSALHAAAAPDTGSLLAALANAGRQNASNTAQGNAIPAAPPAFPISQNVAPLPLPFMPPPPVAPNGQAAPPPPPVPGNDLMPQLLQAITAGLIQPEAAMQLIAALAGNQNGAAPVVPLPPQVPVNANNQPVQQNSAQPERHDQNGSRYRNRSRSPDYNRRRNSPNRRSPPNRRDSPTYGIYDPNAGAEGNSAGRNDRDRGRGRGKHRGRNDYRQRTPPPPRRQPSPHANAPRNMQSKFIDWDHSLPRDHIKVLSRTLFVGGASGTEGEIRNIFNRFGKVQTCIVNQEKRHAFVKMVNRPDAVAAKEGMDRSQDSEVSAKARQTRWGVGFGPRDCSDYNTGVSVIPISRLTDADRKWVLTAEYGGTGGRAIEGGMVIEEPDIEIGAGVSSKAISRRVQQDGGRRGGHHFASRGGFDNGPRFRKPERTQPSEPRHISPRPEAAIGVPPAVPGFGFQLPGMPSGF
ncbi:hypothetical protein K469DRAFT_220995 [Zopfia rhizophila CBS 207.26]|uniref:RNA binding protein Nrd1 n=1 Tax=Zopfia rhizophila CBS 207.26 TaxID=1314779 RepID=A0A6A6DX36_9PEZI|nr:hypothetical protein K469DRAFT_220995 [Zopfia rhizophila CBS 207.26]